jgi:hypothetical protein
MPKTGLYKEAIGKMRALTPAERAELAAGKMPLPKRVVPPKSDGFLAEVNRIANASRKAKQR